MHYNDLHRQGRCSPIVTFSCHTHNTREIAAERHFVIFSGSNMAEMAVADFDLKQAKKKNGKTIISI